MKYIASSIVQSSIGSASIVDLARCEENMDLMLLSLNYEKKSKVAKIGEIIKFKDQPIIIQLYKLEVFNLNTQQIIQTNNNNSESTSNIINSNINNTNNSNNTPNTNNNPPLTKNEYLA